MGEKGREHKVRKVKRVKREGQKVGSRGAGKGDEQSIKNQNSLNVYIYSISRLISMCKGMRRKGKGLR